jgi:hypothetical protein
MSAIATAFAFNPVDVFRNDGFWGFSLLYYVIFVWVGLYGAHLYWEEHEKG